MTKNLKVSAAVLLSLFLISNVFAKDAFETYGDFGQVLLPATAVVMISIQKDKEGAIQFAKAFTSTLAVTYGLKYAVNSERPNGGKHSFPSGHTSSAFAGAAFIQQRYGWEYGLPAYIAAALVGVSRVTSNKHFVGDVFVGAAIGIGANLIFTSKYEKEAITIVPTSNGVLLVLNYNW